MAVAEEEVEVAVEFEVPLSEVVELALPERMSCELVDVEVVCEVLLAINEAYAKIVVDPDHDMSIAESQNLCSRICQCKRDACSPKVVVLVVEPVVTVLTTASVLMADELRDVLWSTVIVELYEM